MDRPTIRTRLAALLLAVAGAAILTAAARVPPEARCAPHHSGPGDFCQAPIR